MRLLLSFVTLLMLAVNIYADDNMTAFDEAVYDNVTNDTEKSKTNIKPKLVPDRLINDKNTFMKDFGFPAREEFKINQNLDAAGKDVYKDVELSMKNRWSKTNIWGRDFLYIEGMLSGGVYGFNMFSIKPANASQKEYVIPYGALSLKLFSGTVFSPELTIKDSKFIFSENGASIDEQEDNYNYYYLKLPLGFYIPFFGWKSEMYIDGSYSSLNNNFSVKSSLMVENSILESGSSFHLSSSYWNVRLYLDTPVVLKPSITEYAYFGLYYEEIRSARTALPGNDYINGNTLLVNYTGIGDIETSRKYNVTYGNTEGLVAYKAEITLGYQHIFKQQGVGVAFDAGVSYAGFVEFFYGKKDGPYSLTLDGDLRYFAEIRFLFGY